MRTVVFADFLEGYERLRMKWRTVKTQNGIVKYLLLQKCREGLQQPTHDPLYAVMYSSLNAPLETDTADKLIAGIFADIPNGAPDITVRRIVESNDSPYADHSIQVEEIQEGVVESVEAVYKGEIELLAFSQERWQRLFRRFLNKVEEVKSRFLEVGYAYSVPRVALTWVYDCVMRAIDVGQSVADKQ